MKKGIRVYTMERGLRKLKAGITIEQYQSKYPSMIKVGRIPSETTLEKWDSDGGCKAVDGCWVEPDGVCEHSYPSWLLALGWI